MTGRINREYHSREQALAVAREVANDHMQPVAVWARSDGRYMVTLYNRRPIIPQWSRLGSVTPEPVNS